ncbi:hypothetical protein [Sphingobacterium sp. LRF_L2]|uniref:hypothetical protein n=1 Tax=Sphingobacterium sp. LRF_L2 TaxID=3369421 RepID=UPI003F5DED64
MRTLLLLVVSCCLLAFWGRDIAAIFSHSEQPAVEHAQHGQLFTKPHIAKKLLYKKALPVSNEAKDSFTETDEDFSYSSFGDLEARALLVFSYAFILVCYPIFTRKPLPFPWHFCRVTSSKYILQRVLRI